MTVRVAVDFGTSSTCVAVSVRGREPQVVVVDGHPLLPSAVYASAEGTLFVGLEAERHAAVDPSRYEPHPKRRIDETELLLGDTVLPVREVIGAVLRRAVAEARRVAGGAVIDQLVLTHPADWGGVRTQVLRQAARGLAARLALVPEPVAAAVFHAATFAPAPGHGRPPGPGQPPRDGPLAVLDVGGGTVDVSVVLRQARPPVPGRPTSPIAHYRVLATRGDPSFGGADVDQLLLDHIGGVVAGTDADAWRSLIEGRELPDRRRRRVIRQDVRGAKETLSRHAYTDVPMPPPFPDAHVTREDLEGLIAEPVERAVRLTMATIAEAGVAPGQLAGIFLVGGSSRIPMVARLVHRHSGVIPTTLDQPETVVARGALRAVSIEPDRTGVLPSGAIAAAGHPDPPPPRPPRPPTPAGGIPVAPPPPFPTAADSSARRYRWLLLPASALVVAAIVLVVIALSSGDSGDGEGRVIAQWEYEFALPDGWTQTGGDPSRLRTEIKPVGGEQGDDLVLVEETRLSFDSDTDRERAVGKLRSDFEAAGDAFSAFDESATFAGRDVIYYRQRLENAGATVDWYVVFDGHTQVSIGCQYTQQGRDLVDRACQTIVRTMTIAE